MKKPCVRVIFPRSAACKPAVQILNLDKVLVQALPKGKH